MKRIPLYISIAAAMVASCTPAPIQDEPNPMLPPEKTGISPEDSSFKVPFEDSDFKDYCLRNFDTDKDGEISAEEAETVTKISVSYASIFSLGGIEYFNNLTELDCSHNHLTSLDMSKNTALTDLVCGSNRLSRLDLSKNTALEYLSCISNELTSLDLSGMTALETVFCDGNHQLTSLDMSGCSALGFLSCEDNQLTRLDISGCTALISLYCIYNQLVNLDVSECTALTQLDCQNNPTLSEIWLKSGQKISDFEYDDTIAAIKYRP